jgi:hypothetical protein
MKFSEDIQKLIPLGYLYLVILGILKDSFFYYQLGINILKYSTIMDILMSPIAEFTSNPVILIAILTVFIFHYYMPSLLLKYGNVKFVQKVFELETTEGLSLNETKSYFISVAIKSLAIVLSSFFLGYGLAGGYFTSNKIRNNKLKYNYRLNYNSGEFEQIYLINTNSLYYFYIAKGSKNIKITPLSTIKNLELSDNKILK